VLPVRCVCAAVLLRRVSRYRFFNYVNLFAMTLSRRTLLQGGCAALATPAFLGTARAAERRFAPQVEGWRSFEISTTVTLPEARGVTRIWLPVPDVNSDYQRCGDNSWSGNASLARISSDTAQGAKLLYAEFGAEVVAPTLTLKSQVQTRNRAVDWSQTRVAREDAAVLRANLQPSELLPLDGVVRETAEEAIGTAQSDVDKVRAIYQWVVDNAYREPTTRGCGMGDIKAMLESKNLGGKCADLNAVFVGLCRAVGVPARDVYGLRLAPSAFGYKELGGDGPGRCAQGDAPGNPGLDQGQEQPGGGAGQLRPVWRLGGQLGGLEHGPRPGAAPLLTPGHAALPDVPAG
jgi:Transglutaminase-like superfamily